MKLDEWQQASNGTSNSKDGALGLEVRAITPEFRQRLHLPDDARGVIITKVEPNTPAEDSRLNEGDIILEIGQQKVTDVATFKKLVEQYGQPGKSLLIRYKRGEQEDITVIRVPSAEK